MYITLFGLLAVLGFLVSGFFLWKRAIDEHLSEGDVFDIYITASVWALIAGRAGAIMLNLDRFGLNPLRWLALFSLPGLEGRIALIVGILMILLGAAKRHWDPWLILDVYLPSILLWQSAVIAPYRWQAAVFWLLWFGLLWWIEHEYRLWEWYRGRRGFARPGLVASVWLIGVGAGFCLIAWVSGDMVFLLVSGMVLVLAGLILGYARSGRVFRTDIVLLSQQIGNAGTPLRKRRPRHTI